MRTAGVLLPYDLHLLLHKQLVLRRLLFLRLPGLAAGRRPSRHGLGLSELALAPAAAVPLRVDAARVALVLARALDALPGELEVDLVAVLSRHVDAAVGKGPGALGRPRLELAAVWVRGHARDHKRRQVAEFMRQHVEQPVLTVDDLVGQFNGGVMPALGGRDGLGGRVGTCGCAGVLPLNSLAPPVCSSCGRVERFGPLKFDTAGGLGQFR